MGASGFRHIGRVVAVEVDGEVSVALDKLAACEGCRAKGKCSVSGGEGTTTIMKVKSGEALMVGELVTVSITYRVGWIAVLFTYLIPLTLFLVSIVALITCGLEQGVAAILTFVVVALYYFGLYLLRERIEQVVEFTVSRV